MLRNSFTQNSSASNEDLDCFDYFIGVDASRQVDEKFSNMDSETIAEIVNALYLYLANMFLMLHYVFLPAAI